jgi:hypothetical protein
MDEGDALLDEEVTIHAVVEGTRCVVCRRAIVEGDRTAIAR